MAGSLIKGTVLFHPFSSFPPSPSDAHTCQENHIEDEIMTWWSHSGCDTISFQQPGKSDVIFSSGRNLTSDRAKSSPDFSLSCCSPRQGVSSQLCQGVQNSFLTSNKQLAGHGAVPIRLLSTGEWNPHMSWKWDIYIQGRENYLVFSFQIFDFSPAPKPGKDFCLLHKKVEISTS